MIALKARSLTMQFGGLRAVAELDLEIPAGAIFGLIGPNGAGKTTFFNVITGLYEPDAGTFELLRREHPRCPRVARVRHRRRRTSGPSRRQPLR